MTTTERYTGQVQPDGATPDYCGAGATLWCAIATANKAGGGVTIAFNIPPSDTGCGSQTINGTAATVCQIKVDPQYPLPALTVSNVTIDGTTQPGSSPNNDAMSDPHDSCGSQCGNDAVLTVQVMNLPGTTPGGGFDVHGSGDTIRGLSLTGFSLAINVANGFDNMGGTLAESGATIAGNFIGVNPDGSAPSDRTAVAVEFSGSGGGDLLGGWNPADQNVLDGDEYTILNSATGTRIVNNKINTRPDGQGTVYSGGGPGAAIQSGEFTNPNGTTETLTIENNVINQAGVGIVDGGDALLASKIDNNLIGATADAAGVIGNAGAGIYETGKSTDPAADIENNVLAGTTNGAAYHLSGARATFTGNWVGTAPNNRNLSNAGDGVWLTDGATGVISGNIIGYNSGNGIHLQDTTGVTVSSNDIGTNDAHDTRMGNGLNGIAIGTPTQGGPPANALIRNNHIWDNGQDGILVGQDSDTTATHGVAISQNSFLRNGPGPNPQGAHGGLSIDLLPVADPGSGEGVSCGAGSATTNDGLACPVITNVTTTAVHGTADATAPGTPCAGCTVEVYLAAPDSDDQGHGEGGTYLGSTTTNPDGTWSWGIHLPPDLTLKSTDSFTATTTTTGQSSVETSEFAANASVPWPTLALRSASEPATYSEPVSIPVALTDPDTSATLTLSASGLPSGLTLSDASGTGGRITGTIGGQMLAPATDPSSPYTVTLTGSDGLNQVSGTFQINVSPELLQVSVPGIEPVRLSGNSHDVTVSATVVDGDGHVGDLSGWTPSFVLAPAYGPGTSSTCSATVGSSGSGGAYTKTCTLAGMPAGVYAATVAAPSGPQTYLGSGSTPVVVYDGSTKPLEGTGSLPLSKTVSADLGVLARFSSSTAQEGGVVYVEHRPAGNGSPVPYDVVLSGHVDSYSVNTSTKTATINGQAIVSDPTHAGGRGTFTLTLADAGNGAARVSLQTSGGSSASSAASPLVTAGGGLDGIAFSNITTSTGASFFIPSQAPDAVKNLSGAVVAAQSGGTLDVSWAAPASANGTGINGYTVTVQGMPSADVPASRCASTGGNTLCSYSVGVPSATSSLTVGVSAYNNAGSGPSASTTAKPNTPPKFGTDFPKDQTYAFGQKGSNLAFTVTDAEKTDTLSLSVTGLPAGMSFTAPKPATGGKLSGTIKVGTITANPGDYTVAVHADDGFTAGTTQTFVVHVKQAKVTITNTTNNGKPVDLKGAQSTAVTLSGKVTGMPVGAPIVISLIGSAGVGSPLGGALTLTTKVDATGTGSFSATLSNVPQGAYDVSFAVSDPLHRMVGLQDGVLLVYNSKDKTMAWGDGASTRKVQIQGKTVTETDEWAIGSSKNGSAGFFRVVEHFSDGTTAVAGNLDGSPVTSTVNSAKKTASATSTGAINLHYFDTTGAVQWLTLANASESLAIDGVAKTTSFSDANPTNENFSKAAWSGTPFTLFP